MEGESRREKVQVGPQQGVPGPGVSVSVTEHSGHPTGRSWRHGGGQAALAELCA